MKYVKSPLRKSHPLRFHIVVKAVEPFVIILCFRSISPTLSPEIRKPAPSLVTVRPQNRITLGWDKKVCLCMCVCAHSEICVCAAFAVQWDTYMRTLFFTR